MTRRQLLDRACKLSNGAHVCVFCRGGERDELLSRS